MAEQQPNLRLAVVGDGRRCVQLLSDDVADDGVSATDADVVGIGGASGA